MSINMTVEEYETIRLIDLEGKTQQECSERMEVARTTVQGIYDVARKKLADALVNGKHLNIGGGDYELCTSGGPGHCKWRKECPKRRIDVFDPARYKMREKGDKSMKIALPVNEDKETVCISFGRTPLFLVVDAATGEKEYVDNSAAASQGGAGIKAAQILVDNGVDVLLTPRCGENAAAGFQAAEAAMYKTEGDSVEENLAAFKAGKLAVLSEIHSGLHNHGGK